MSGDPVTTDYSKLCTECLRIRDDLRYKVVVHKIDTGEVIAWNRVCEQCFQIEYASKFTMSGPEGDVVVSQRGGNQGVDRDGVG